LGRFQAATEPQRPQLFAVGMNPGADRQAHSRPLLSSGRQRQGSGVTPEAAAEAQPHQPARRDCVRPRRGHNVRRGISTPLCAVKAFRPADAASDDALFGALGRSAVCGTAHGSRPGDTKRRHIMSDGSKATHQERHSHALLSKGGRQAAGGALPWRLRHRLCWRRCQVLAADYDVIMIDARNMVSPRPPRPATPAHRGTIWRA
jgi:hypothetical protein